MRLGTTLTLSFWMKLDSVPSAATRLVGKGASDTAQNYGVWTAAGDQHLFFKFHNGTTLQSVSTTTTFSIGTWYHVAVTLGSGQVQFFVNGAAQSAVAATGARVARAGFSTGHKITALRFATGIQEKFPASRRKKGPKTLVINEFRNIQPR